MKNVLKPLAKSASILLALPVAAPATDAAIQKKIFRLHMTTLIISNEEINDIMRINEKKKRKYHKIPLSTLVYW